MRFLEIGLSSRYTHYIERTPEKKYKRKTVINILPRNRKTKVKHKRVEGSRSSWRFNIFNSTFPVRIFKIITLGFRVRVVTRVVSICLFFSEIWRDVIGTSVRKTRRIAKI